MNAYPLVARRVLEVFPDAHGLVRDVTVGTRSRRGRPENSREYKSRPLDEQRVPVQRLTVLLPLEEQQDLPPAGGLHVCEEDLRVPLPGQELPDHHLPPDPEPQSAPGPTEHGELESNPELADKVVINAFVQFADHASQVQHHSDYFCWECDFREKFMYDQR